ncbi:MAG: YdcF family protein [Shewanellaceae bacterium]|nr:YdcF family protein [Shewanellaceae bacterium]
MFELLFFLKKAISFLLMPLGLTLLLGCLGWYLGKYKIALLGTLTALVLFSSGFVAQWAVQSLEQPYWVPLPTERPCVVHVLGHAHKVLPMADPVLALSQVALARLTVGLRELAQAQSKADCVLVLSGGQDHARVMAAAARDLGYQGELLQLPIAKDTVEEAYALKALGRFNQVSLVTSALHMQRAQAIFTYYGVEVVPVPADFQTQQSTYPWLSLGNLKRLTLAWHEYVGQLWFTIVRTLAEIVDESPFFGRNR